MDEPVPLCQEEIDETIRLFPVERIPERNGNHIVDVPMPQTSEEVAEVVKAVKKVKKVPLKRISEKIDEQIDVAPASHSLPQIVNEIAEVGKATKIVPQECISGRICDQIDDDLVPVDQPGDQTCRNPQACGVAATGPSVSDSGKDGGSPAHAVHRRNSLTSSGQEELRSLRQRFRDTALWSLLAKQEDATVNVPVPQIAVPVPFQKETDEVMLPVTAERLSERTVEQIVDMPVPQIQEQIVEVAQTIPQERNF